jgi:hypothetical protein
MKKNIQELANKGLINRFAKILNSDRMDEWTADTMIGMLHDWKNSYTERALKKLDEQIAKMQEMRTLTLQKLENEKKSRE